MSVVHVEIAALRSIEREKEIAFDTIIDALETALLSAYKTLRIPCLMRGWSSTAKPVRSSSGRRSSTRTVT